MYRRQALALAPIALLTLAGCGSREPEHRADPTIDSPAVPDDPESTAPTPSAGVTTEDTETDPGSIHTNEQDIADARAAVMTTMEIWVQGSTMNQADWQAALNETLTPDGAERISSNVWGYRVADTRIEGEPEVLRADPTSATFAVATDASSYEVTAVPLDSEGEKQWKVSSLNEAPQ